MTTSAIISKPTSLDALLDGQHPRVKRRPEFAEAKAANAACAKARAAGDSEQVMAQLALARAKIRAANDAVIPEINRVIGETHDRLRGPAERYAAYDKTAFLLCWRGFDDHWKARRHYQALEMLSTLEIRWHAFVTLVEPLEALAPRLAWIGARDPAWLPAERARFAARHGLDDAGLKALTKAIGAIEPKEKSEVSRAFDEARRALGLGATGSDRAVARTLEDMASANVIRRGRLLRAYLTGDGPPGFCVAWTVKGLDDLVIHARCRADGSLAPDVAAHWALDGSEADGGRARGLSQAFSAKMTDWKLHKAQAIKDIPQIRAGRIGARGVERRA